MIAWRAEWNRREREAYRRDREDEVKLDTSRADSPKKLERAASPRPGFHAGGQGRRAGDAPAGAAASTAPRKEKGLPTSSTPLKEMGLPTSPKRVNKEMGLPSSPIEVLEQELNHEFGDGCSAATAMVIDEPFSATSTPPPPAASAGAAGASAAPGAAPASTASSRATKTTTITPEKARAEHPWIGKVSPKAPGATPTPKPTPLDEHPRLTPAIDKAEKRASESARLHGFAAAGCALAGNNNDGVVSGRSSTDVKRRTWSMATHSPRSGTDTGLGFVEVSLGGLGVCLLLSLVGGGVDVVFCCCCLLLLYFVGVGGGVVGVRCCLWLLYLYLPSAVQLLFVLWMVLVPA